MVRLFALDVMGIVTNMQKSSYLTSHWCKYNGQVTNLKLGLVRVLPVRDGSHQQLASCNPLPVIVITWSDLFKCALRFKTQAYVQRNTCTKKINQETVDR